MVGTGCDGVPEDGEPVGWLDESVYRRAQQQETVLIHPKGAEVLPSPPAGTSPSPGKNFGNRAQGVAGQSRSISTQPAISHAYTTTGGKVAHPLPSAVARLQRGERENAPRDTRDEHGR